MKNSIYQRGKIDKDFKAELKRGWHGPYGKSSNEGFTTIIPDSMGVVYSYHNTMKEALEAVKEFNDNKEKIWEIRQATDYYCGQNPWTRSGT